MESNKIIIEINFNNFLIKKKKIKKVQFYLIYHVKWIKKKKKNTTIIYHIKCIKKKKKVLWRILKIIIPRVI